MRTALLALLGLTLVSAPAARAGSHELCRFESSCCDRPARWAERYDERDARVAITNREGQVTLLLTRDVVAMQLSDRTLRHIRRELRHDHGEDDDNAFAQAIKAAVAASLGSILNHSAECPIRDLKDVDYRDGRLVFITNDGRSIFESVEIDDEDALRGFSASDARLFVKEFRRLKGRES